MRLFFYVLFMPFFICTYIWAGDEHIQNNFQPRFNSAVNELLHKEAIRYCAIGPTTSTTLLSILAKDSQSMAVINNLISEYMDSTIICTQDNIGIVNANNKFLFLLLTIRLYCLEVEVQSSPSPLAVIKSCMQKIIAESSKNSAVTIQGMIYTKYMRINLCRILVRNGKEIASKSTYKELNDFLSALHHSLTIPNYEAVSYQYQTIAVLGLLIEKYKQQNGVYPAMLDDLLVKPTLLRDIFSPTDNSVIYMTTGNKWLLKSVGANKRDDGFGFDKYIPFPHEVCPDIVLLNSTAEDMVQFFKNKNSSVHGLTLIWAEDGELIGVSH